MTARPQMAAGHELSDDKLRWRITLRDGLVFHDGEKVRAAELNFVAGRKAKASTAYASASNYLAAGIAILSAACGRDFTAENDLLPALGFEKLTLADLRRRAQG